MREIHPTVFVAPTASLYGRLRIGEGSSVWFQAVVRAECQQVVVGRRSNVQDFVMIHVGFDHPSVIGDFCSIAHHAVVHGATVGDACLIGVGAVLMDGAVIGSGSIVAGGAVVREGSVFEPGTIIAGVPAVAVKKRDCSRANRLNAWLYHRNAECYRRGDHRAWDGEEFERWKAAKIAAIERDEDVD